MVQIEIIQVNSYSKNVKGVSSFAYNCIIYYYDKKIFWNQTDYRIFIVAANNIIYHHVSVSCYYYIDLTQGDSPQIFFCTLIIYLLQFQLSEFLSSLKDYIFYK